jgi:hypothetical protein
MIDSAELIKEFKIIIGEELLSYSGGVFNSPKDTFKKNDFYLVGLNPGQSGLKEEQKIKYSIEYNLDEYFGAKEANHIYVDHNWPLKNERYHGAGNAPFQLSIKSFFDCLGQDLRGVCCSNLHFIRTKDEIELNKILKESPEITSKSLKIQEMLLDQIQPKNIVVFSNTTYLHLKRLFIAKQHGESNLLIPGTNEKIDSGHGRWKIRLRKFILKDGRTFNIIRVPHFSRYSFHTKSESIRNSIKNNVLEYISNS